MNPATRTRYSPHDRATTMSCGRSSTVWSSRSREWPFRSRAYPRRRAVSTEIPTSFRVKCVRGRFVMSNRVVPSLNTQTSCFARQDEVAVLDSSLGREEFAEADLFLHAATGELEFVAGGRTRDHGGG